MTYDPHVLTDRNKIDTSHLCNIPEPMKTGTSFVTWFLGPKTGADLNSDTPELTKVPCDNQLRKLWDAQDLTKNRTYDSQFKSAQKLITIGLASMGYAIDPRYRRVCIDIDYKKLDATVGAWATWNGYRMPYVVAAMAQRAIEEGGAYVEVSPSGLGLHIWLSAVPTGAPGTRWHFSPAHLDACACVGMEIEGELYYQKHFITFTGMTLLDEAHTAALRMPTDGELPGQAFLDEFLSQTYAKTGRAPKNKDGSPLSLGDLDISKLSAEVGSLPGYTPADQLSGALAAAVKDPVFTRLWDADLTVLKELGGTDFTPSAARWHLMGRLVKMYRGDVQQVVDAFKMCKLLDSSALGRRGADVKFIYEIKRRVAGYLHSRAEGASTAVSELDWPAEARAGLLSVITTTAQGGPTQRTAVSDLVAALLTHLDRPDGYHIYQARAVLHTNGVKALADSLGRRSPDVTRLLTWAAEVGVIATFVPAANTPDGKAIIALDARSSDCLALRGLLQQRPIPPRPGAVWKPRAASEPRMKRPQTLTQARWTMLSVLSGVSTPADIAERTGQAMRSVKQHLKTLCAEGLIDAANTPLVSAENFEERRVIEMQQRQSKTRQRAVADRARWAQGWRKDPHTEPLPPEALAVIDAWVDLYAQAEDFFFYNEVAA